MKKALKPTISRKAINILSALALVITNPVDGKPLGGEEPYAALVSEQIYRGLLASKSLSKPYDDCVIPLYSLQIPLVERIKQLLIDGPNYLSSTEVAALVTGWYLPENTYYSRSMHPISTFGFPIKTVKSAHDLFRSYMHRIVALHCDPESYSVLHRVNAYGQSDELLAAFAGDFLALPKTTFTTSNNVKKCYWPVRTGSLEADDWQRLQRQTGESILYVLDASKLDSYAASYLGQDQVVCQKFNEALDRLLVM